MDYEKKYKEALKRAREWYNKTEPDSYTCIVESIFPELKESEDERIRETLIKFHKSTIDIDGIKGKDIISWLEKQGEIENINNDDLATLEIWEDIIKENKEKWQLSDWFIEATSQLIQKVKYIEKQGNKPKQTSIWKHWKDGIAGNGEGEPIYLVKNGNTYSLNSCLGCECDYIELSELDNLMLEKQANKPQGKTALEAAKEEKADNSNKIEPNFKVGDILKHNKTNIICKVLSANVGFYCLMNILGGKEMELSNVEKNFHLWTIQDAKDGDVLYSPCCKLLWIYKDGNSCYIGNNLNYNENCVVVNSPICIPTDVVPATKEQRELLFAKIKEIGYTWDAEHKELKKVEQIHAWSQEDENILKNLTDYFMVDDCLQFKEGKIVKWLESLKNRIKGD